MAANPLSALEFRHALGQFATGVTVVTAERGPGLVHGMTANSFASVSLDPPLILICVDQRAHLLPMVLAKKRFGVSVLKEDQRAMAEYFAQPEENAETEEHLGVRFGWTSTGIPVLEDTLVQLGCNVVASYLSGDHTVFIGEVESAKISSGEPLLFFRGQYRQISPPL
jgi:flavin reductase